MPSTDHNETIATEILTDLSLREKNIIAHMDEMDIEFLAYVFDRYISEKAPDSDPTEGMEIMREVWRELSKTHMLKVVK